MLGIHQSFSNPMCDTIHNLGERETFQIMTRNPRSLAFRYIGKSEINHFNTTLLRRKCSTFVVHAPYAMNPALAPNKAFYIIQEDMDFLANLAGIKYYVLHPGSGGGLSYRLALNNLAAMLHEVDAHGVEICVELMAGAGTQLLDSWSQLDYMIVKGCNTFTFDTAHCYGAGLDIFDTYFRFQDYFKVVHFNSTNVAFGSHVDRHENIHKGVINPEYLLEFYESIPKQIPVILETPREGILDDYIYLENKKSEN